LAQASKKTIQELEGKLKAHLFSVFGAVRVPSRLSYFDTFFRFKATDFQLTLQTNKLKVLPGNPKLKKRLQFLVLIAFLQAKAHDNELLENANQAATWIHWIHIGTMNDKDP